MTAACYELLSKTGKISIKRPVSDEVPVNGTCLDIKLKPPKFPKKWETSKKTYKDLFIRSLKHSSEHHIYARNGLYVVSLYKSFDEAIEWIDKRYDEILKRIENYDRGNINARFRIQR